MAFDLIQAKRGWVRRAVGTAGPHNAIRVSPSYGWQIHRVTRDAVHGLA